MYLCINITHQYMIRKVYTVYTFLPGIDHLRTKVGTWPRLVASAVERRAGRSAGSRCFASILVSFFFSHTRRSLACAFARSLAQPRAATAGTYVTSSSYRLDVERGSPLTFPRPTLSQCGSACVNNPDSSNLFFPFLVVLCSFLSPSSLVLKGTGCRGLLSNPPTRLLLPLCPRTV